MAKLNDYLRVFSRHPTHADLRWLIPANRVVVRFGSQTPSMNLTEINTVEAVNASTDKLVMKQRFENVCVSPQFWTLNMNGLVNDVDYKEIELSYPILAKRSFRSRGIGMKKLNTREEFIAFMEQYVINKEIQNRNPYYIEKFHNYSREYRLHISEFGCFYACRKMLKEDAENRWYRNDSNSVWVTERNSTFDDNGNLIDYVGENELFNKPITWNRIVEDCQNARIALGLDICCFDVKVNREGNWIILESNSAPSFGKITLIKYKEELTKIVNNKLTLQNV